MVDLHRVSNPSDNTQFTKWSMTPNGRVGTRIDNIFVEESQIARFSDSTLRFSPHSDHYALTTTYKQTNTGEHGKGHWKINLSIIPSIRSKLIGILQETLSQTSPTAKQWEEFKSRTQAESIRAAIPRYPSAQTIIDGLHKKIQHMDLLLADRTTRARTKKALIKKKDAAKHKLQHLLQDKFEGWRIRSRAKWVEQGERSTRYFHRLLAARRTANYISKLRTPAGTLVSDIDDITKTARSFYETLYSKGTTSVQA